MPALLGEQELGSDVTPLVRAGPHGSGAEFPGSEAHVSPQDSLYFSISESVDFIGMVLT